MADARSAVRPRMQAGARGALLLALLVPGLAGLPAEARQDAAGAPSAGSGERPAQHLHSGSIARGRVVALGRDLVVDGRVLGHAVALEGSATISGEVEGDVVVLGGDVRLGASAQVGGDVYVLGGSIDAASGSVVGGRMIAYPEAGSAWLALVEGPSLGLSPASPIVIGAKMALLSFWCLLSIAVFALARRSVLRTSEGIREEPFRNFFVGLTAVASFVVTSLFFYALTGAMVGIPLLGLLLVVALGLRFWGMVAVFHALGQWASERFAGRREHAPLFLAAVGLALLGLLRFVPWLGTWVWTIATLIGVGAALTTRLGRRDPWLEGL